MTDELRLKVSLLPDSPGVYMYFNAEGTVIYVGKAKKLKRRVSSYFNRVHPVLRTNMLVRNIVDMKYIVVNTEEEALDLENSLIKEYQPHYNVLLKDDKSYPWICVSRETFPRVFITREEVTRGARYFGPYPKAEVAHALLEVVKKMYPLRTCRHPLTRDNLAAKRYPLCLQYHIKNCLGPCQGFVKEEVYQAYIDDVIRILRGDTKQVSDYLLQEMQSLAAELKFEEAHELKRKYLLIENYRARSVIVNPTIHNIDVFSILTDDGSAFVNFMHLRRGTIVQSATVEYKFRDIDTGETEAEILSSAIRDMRQRFGRDFVDERVREVVVNVMPEFSLEGTEFVIPQRGDKRKLLAISLKNAEQYRDEKLKRMEKLNPEQRVMRTLTTLQRDFHLKELPRHIECFDNSHTGGSEAVASCVVFINGKPSKKDYRHFIIKEADGSDDYASMREVITRRYTRLVAEDQPLPQLLVVDGGKGQLNAALEALDAIGLRGTIAAVGLAKRLEEVFFPGDSVPYFLDKTSESIRVVQHLRDEAHRFGIKHHRDRRSKGQIHSALDDVNGVGEKSKQQLLKRFKSVKRIREAALIDLADVIGPARAKLVYNAFHPSE